MAENLNNTEKKNSYAHTDSIINITKFKTNTNEERRSEKNRSATEFIKYYETKFKEKKNDSNEMMR